FLVVGFFFAISAQIEPNPASSLFVITTVGNCAQSYLIPIAPLRLNVSQNWMRQCCVTPPNLGLQGSFEGGRNPICLEASSCTMSTRLCIECSYFSLRCSEII